jgi:hypothetical protein
MALLAVMLGSFAFPFPRAHASAATIEMSMEMGNTVTMPCMHGTKKPPCCPQPCPDMAACVTGGFVVASRPGDAGGADRFQPDRLRTDPSADTAQALRGDDIATAHPLI